MSDGATATPRVTRTLRRLWRHLGGSTRRNLIVAIAGSVVIAAAEVVGVGTMLPLMQLLTGADPNDHALLRRLSAWAGTTDPGELTVIAALVVFSAFLLKGVLSLGFKWWLLGFLYRDEAATSHAMLQRFLRAPYGIHQARHTGEFLRVIGESVGQTYGWVIVASVGAVTELLSVAFIFLTLVWIEPSTALGAMAYLALSLGGYLWLVRGRAQRYGRAMNASSLKVFTSAHNAIVGVKEIQVRGVEGHFLDDYLRLRLSHASTRRKASFISEFPKLVLELVFVLGIAMLALALFSTRTTPAALASLALFAAGGLRALPSLVRLLASLNMVRIGLDSAHLVLDELADDESLVDPGAAGDDRPAVALRTAITCDDLSFTYPSSERPALDGVDLVIPRGGSLALVGRSGSGKSTLVDLLLGLHAPSRGSVTVDGTSVQELGRGWQRSVGLVPQEVFLIDDSLLNNVVLGLPLDRERAEQCLRKAHLGAIVDRDGLDASIGERGARLSGGQRQRVGIARALYVSPHVLILDEATSALDNETEFELSQTLQELSGELTMVIVAHRLSTVKNCDQVAFLQEGRLAALGTMAAVAAQSPEFARMVELGSLNLDEVNEEPAP